MQIMKIIQIQIEIMKISETKNRNQHDNHANYENLRNPNDNHNNYKNQTHAHENLKIIETLEIRVNITNIMKIIEIHMRITTNNENLKNSNESHETT